jgi:hypothetical protein
MRILCLDLSTHLGFAIFEGEFGSKPVLVEGGTLHLNKSVHEFGPYPFSYQKAAQGVVSMLSAQLGDSVDDFGAVVIEEINLGRNRYTQKLLENIHTAILGWIIHWASVEHVVYLDSSEWRSNLGLKMSKEQKKLNAKLSKAKREAAAFGVKLDKKAVGVKGKTTSKHLAVAHANEAYGLKLLQKDNDQADAICLGLAFCNGAVPCDGM